MRTATDRDTDASTYANGYSCAGAYGHADHDIDIDAGAYADRDTDCYAYTHAYADRRPDRYAYAHAYADRRPDRYAYAHACADRDTVAHANTNCDTNGHADTDPDNLHQLADTRLPLQHSLQWPVCTRLRLQSTHPEIRQHATILDRPKGQTPLQVHA